MFLVTLRSSRLPGTGNSWGLSLVNTWGEKKKNPARNQQGLLNGWSTPMTLNVNTWLLLSSRVTWTWVNIFNFNRDHFYRHFEKFRKCACVQCGSDVISQVTVTVHVTRFMLIFLCKFISDFVLYSAMLLLRHLTSIFHRPVHACARVLSSNLVHTLNGKSIIYL